MIHAGLRVTQAIHRGSSRRLRQRPDTAVDGNLTLLANFLLNGWFVVRCLPVTRHLTKLTEEIKKP